MKTLPYSQKTQDLIDRLYAIAERKEYTLDKERGEELILKTYDLFNLPRPKKIVWFDCVTEEFIDSASSASSAYSAYSASTDYDFDYSVCNFEFLQNPEGLKITEDDKKYFEYSKLVIDAKEAGVGYFCDYEDTLFLVPVPIISCDIQGRYHSTERPAIEWEGEKLYYLCGVKFEKEWWDKIRRGELSAEEVFAIDNVEHRRVAYEMMDKEKMKELKNFKVIDEGIDEKGKSAKLISFNVQNMEEDLMFYNCIDASTDREYWLQVKNDIKTWKQAKDSMFGLLEVEWVNEW